jgi:hypothetical protein
MYVQNTYIYHVCIVINDGCELKYIWTWMNVNKWIHPQLSNTIDLFQYYIHLHVII